MRFSAGSATTVLWCLFWSACHAGHASRAQIAVSGFGQVLSALSAPTITDASLAVSCADGHSETADAIDINSQVVTFTDVAACGRAHLTLTAQAQDGAGAGYTFVGDAEATLSPGEVEVTFVGSLTASAASTAIAKVSVAPVGFQVLNIPVRDPATQDYDMVISRDAKAFTVKIDTVSPTAAVSIDGQAGPTQTVVFAAGKGTDVVVQVSENGTTASTIIHVRASALPDNATLSALSLLAAAGNFVLQPALAPEVFSYKALGPAGTASVSVQAAASDSKASLTIDNAIDSNGALALALGVTVLSLRVVAQDGITYNDYAVDVVQGPVDAADASLLALSTDVGILVPPFNPAISDYTLLLSTRRRQVEITAITAQSAARINGLSNPVTLSNFTPVSDMVMMTVTPADGKSALGHYNISITRGLLQNLVFTNLSWDGFSATQFRYTVGIGPGQTKTTVTATAPPAVQLLLTGGTSAALREHTREPMASSMPVVVDYGVGLNQIVVDASVGDEYETYFLDSISDGIVPGFAVAEIGPSLVGTQSVSGTQPAPGVSAPIAGGHAMAVTPDGKAVYFTTTAGLGQYAVGDSSASVTPMSTSGPIAIDPTGRYLYVATGTELVLISTVDGSVHPQAQVAVTALAADPAGRFLYVGRDTPYNDILTYEILDHGALRQIPSSEFLNLAPIDLEFAGNDVGGVTLLAADGASAYEIGLHNGTVQGTPVITAVPGIAHLAAALTSYEYTQSGTEITEYLDPLSFTGSVLGACVGVTVNAQTSDVIFACNGLLYVCAAGALSLSCPSASDLGGVTALHFFSSY